MLGEKVGIELNGTYLAEVRENYRAARRFQVF